MVSQEQQVVEQSRFNSTSNSPSKADQLLREAFIRKWQRATGMRLFAMIVPHSAPLSSLDRTTTFRSTRFRDIAPCRAPPLTSLVSLLLMRSIGVSCATMEHLFIVRRCAWPRACLTFLEQGLVLLIWFKISIGASACFCLRNVDSNRTRSADTCSNRLTFSL